ncbi:hypothetical protein SAMN05428996_1936 [Quadrisphaera sp. DSM 44207]|nr:hypothetical protein SAMN05428996_1936 [Quadrisphaera sp. DSM 44207]
MTADPDLALRQAVLAVAVLDDVDLNPAGAGIVVAGAVPVRLSWEAVRAVVAGHAPGSPAARARLRAWLRQHRAVADLGAGAAGALLAGARAVGQPVDGALHPGSAWVRERVRGGALEVGLGALDLLPGEDEPAPLWPDVAAAAGLDADAAWQRAVEHRARMAELAVARLARDAHLAAGLPPAGPDGPRARPLVLRPVGGVDVPALLAAPVLRAHLAAGDGTGLRAVAVPVRTRGWVDPARVDPAFAGAAWSASDVEQRAFPRPLLVTAEEVAVAGRPAQPGQPRWPGTGSPATGAASRPATRAATSRATSWPVRPTEAST